MRTIVIGFCLLFIAVLSNAQQNYDVSLIPKDLIPYASAVVRHREITIEVRDLDNVVTHVKGAITVLNKNGDDFARIVLEHDKSNSIRYIKGSIYNSFGQQTGKFSESDFEDVSAYDGFSLYTNARLKHYLPAVNTYPYTIAYDYETRSKQSLNFEEWQPDPHTGISVEKSSFVFSCKPDFEIRYKETNVKNKVTVGNNAAGLKTYTWAADGLKAIKAEPYSPFTGNYLTSVQIAPDKFTYYGLNGTFTNWKELGKWNYNMLVANRQELPQETIDHVREITKSIAEPKLKAKRIYEYMQAKTHYISVQVGVGGYQPFLAADVDKQNYGDCKALVNYTQALLKAVNIESYYCVVEAGDAYKVSLTSDFASMQQGNHIILCLPFKNDTTWADCTSQTIPFGYLGRFTDDRNVLACTPEGGKLMHTPKYTTDNNAESRKAEFTIGTDGELSGDMISIFKGVDYESRSFMIGETKEEQNKSLQRIYGINNLDIDKVDYERYKAALPYITEKVKLHARDYAALNDGKLFFLINSVDRDGEPPRQVHNRLNDVYINRGFIEEDEITYTLPEGYGIEKDPLDVSVEKPFGSFMASMVIKGDKIIYKRRFKLIDGTYNKDTYNDLVEFYQLAYEADHYTVSLVKKP